MFLFSSRSLGKESVLTNIVFKWLFSSYDLFVGFEDMVNDHFACPRVGAGFVNHRSGSYCLVKEAAIAKADDGPRVSKGDF